MRALILQPPYPAGATPDRALACLNWMRERIAAIPAGGCDLLVLPEYANCPGLITRTDMISFSGSEGVNFMRDVAAEASRIRTLVVAGIVESTPAGLFNRAVLLGPDKARIGEVDKVHLTATERDDLGMVAGNEPKIIEWRDLRIGFAVCFDVYFPEYMSALALLNPDLVISPSYQRSETAARLRFLSQARAFDTGACFLRSSYAMEDSPGRGGHGMVVSPAGEILVDAGDVAGVVEAEFDPRQRFCKPAAHGRAEVEHRALIAGSRRADVYAGVRQGSGGEPGKAPFPRVCAHRGISHACPENTLPAFGAAIAAGAHEIEFDLWLSADEVAVVCHDPDLERTTNIKGKVTGMRWADIRRADAGIRTHEKWSGVLVPRFEEVLEVAGGRVGLNIHIKDPGPEGRLVRMVCDRLRAQGLTGSAYIAGAADVLEVALKYAPEIERACLDSQSDPVRQIEVAKRFACARAQFGRHVTGEHLTAAKEAGLIRNLFWSDDAGEARGYVERGIDVILTNCAHRMSVANWR